MKQIFFAVVFILSAFTFSAAAQTLFIRETFEKGISSANKGEFESALKSFQAALASPDIEETNRFFRAKIHFNVGVCFYQMNLQSKAAREFEQAIVFDPHYEKAFYALGMAQFELKNLAESEKAFQRAINLNKQNGETWFDLAFVYLASEDYKSAEAAFQKSIRHKSVSSGIGHNNLGVIFALNRNFKAAIKEFELALSITKGKLTAAENNLQFCKTRQSEREAIAKLEFSK